MKESEPVVDMHARPRIIAKARLKYDKIRDRQLLLLPERVVVLNKTAGAILLLLDGQRTTADVVSILAADCQDPNSNILADVLEFLQDVRARGWIKLECSDG
ncbi:hypothetical protein BH10CYA1_BH10CYA1_48250 [soil metagenome]